MSKRTIEPTAEQTRVAMGMLHATFARGKATAGTASLVARLIAERDAATTALAKVHELAELVRAKRVPDEVTRERLVEIDGLYVRPLMGETEQE